jgi:hypothetical protein
MTSALLAALICAGAMLATTTYFILGSIPLLVLKHDTPLDARFVRAFFNTYYVAALASATATTLSLVIAGRAGIAAAAAVLAVVAAILRKQIIPTMDSIGAQIQSDFGDAIPAFRRTHITAILINIVQLVVIVWILMAVSR